MKLTFLVFNHSRYLSTCIQICLKNISDVDHILGNYFFLHNNSIKNINGFIHNKSSISPLYNGAQVTGK